MLKVGKSMTSGLVALEKALCAPEFELELIQSQIAQKPVLRGEVGEQERCIRLSHEAL